MRKARLALEPKLPALLPSFDSARLIERRQELVALGTPESLAAHLAIGDAAEFIPDISLVASMAGTGIDAAARAFFSVSEAFRIDRIESAAQAITPSDYYDGLALSRAGDTIDAARRGIAIAALTAFGGSDDPVAAWLAMPGASALGGRASA